MNNKSTKPQWKRIPVIIFFCFGIFLLTQNYPSMFFEIDTLETPSPMRARAGTKPTFMELCRSPAGVDFSNSHISNVTYIQEDDRFYIRNTRSCDEFRKMRQYINKPGTKEEEEFPLAFSILMYSDVDRAERLLRAIYQPQNEYCIHVDKSANRTIHRAINGIASCFDNIFVIAESINVKWGTFSVLEAELLCMKELLKHKWKYFINLTGQEFPLKTNWELVQILKAYNGANDVDGTSKQYVALFIFLSIQYL